MGYEEFVEAYMKKLQEKLEPEKVTLTRLPLNKVNETVDCISVRYPDTPVAPAVHLQEKYENYQSGRPMEALVNETVNQIHESRRNPREVPELSEEAARKNLYCAVINAEKNQELLKEVPHETIEDLAVVAKYRVGRDGSFIVTNDMCKHFHMTSEEVMECAHRNTDAEKFQCRTLDDILRSMMRAKGLPEDHINDVFALHGSECPMYVLTNATGTDGAAAIVSAKALEQARETVGESYIVLPSSRHEVLLIPQSFVPEEKDIRNLEEIVHQVNSRDVKPGDRLSDHVYKYDGRSKTITIADTRSLTKVNEQNTKITRTHGRKH